LAADNTLQELMRAANVHAFISRDIAGYYAMIDHTDEALNYVEQAINLGYINYPFLAFRTIFFIVSEIVFRQWSLF